jgi:Na+-transporting methylmalonyl-CoA/oxaloacetate decarboxylase gamma subunit
MRRYNFPLKLINMARNHKLLLAMSIAVAAVGFVGLVLNIRALMDSKMSSTMDSKVSSNESPSESSTEVTERAISEQKEQVQPPVVAASPAMTQQAQTFSHSKEELSQLLKKSKDESEVCKAKVDKARAKLSKTLMSAEEFKQALKLLEESDLTPPSSQQIYLAFEEGMPTNWDGSSFLDNVITAGGCETVIHYKLLKSVVEKAAKHPGRFPIEQIRSASRAFLYTGAERPSPLSVEMMRVSFLKDLVQAKEVDPSFESKVSDLDALARGLMDKIQDDLRACQNAPDCLKSLPNEFEQSRKVREAYLRLLKEIWPNQNS